MILQALLLDEDDIRAFPSGNSTCTLSLILQLSASAVTVTTRRTDSREVEKNERADDGLLWTRGPERRGSPAESVTYLF